MRRGKKTRIIKTQEGANVVTCNGIRIPQSGKFLPVESGILGSGIRKTAQEVRNSTKDWIEESNFN